MGIFGFLFNERKSLPAKNDLKVMKRACEAEISASKTSGLVPAPYFFNRVAILSRKCGNYKQEIAYCENYIKIVESYYASNKNKRMADVRKGPTFKAIEKRLPKARELQVKRKDK